jgi:hypothetical protein
MSDIKTYIIALLIIALIRWIIPKIGMFVNWLILKFVKLAEKLIKGSRLGDKKKRLVLKLLRLFGVKSSIMINELIDVAVDVMNSKQDGVKSDITSNLSDKVDQGIDKVTQK